MSFVVTVFIFAVLILVSTVVSAFIINKKRFWGNKSVLYIISGGVALSSFAMFLPIYSLMFDTYKAFFSILLSIHNTLRLFAIDGEFNIVSEFFENEVNAVIPDSFANIYMGLFAILFVSSPLLTFSIVLSFFKNLISYFKYRFYANRDAYIFSELNEKTLTLATDLKGKHPKSIIVFCGISNNIDSPDYLLDDDARSLHAILFRKGIVDIAFDAHGKNASVKFFCMREDEDKNINEAVELIKRYKNRENTNVFVFSERLDAELVLGAVDKGAVKVRRINEVQSLINNILYESGYEIFDSANPAGKDGLRKINAVIVGLGRHGMAMAKSLPWFCQMTGYKFEMHVFDKMPNRFSNFVAECPELLDKEHIKKEPTDEDAFYSIYSHSGCDVYTAEFDDVLKSIGDATYVFVSLGSDEANLRAAIRLRTSFEKIGIKPIIKTVIYDSDKSKTFMGIKNQSDQLYDITFVGDLKSSFTEDVIVSSEVETIALERHKRWSDEDSFWGYEYNYKSSIASAIHLKYKKYCRVPGIELPPEDRSTEDRDAIRKLEHRRWNAYMRSIGYTYSKERNDLAKTHHCLVDFEKLPEKEKEKDDD